MNLKLDTDYTKTGNSSERQIDTLAIAMTGDDYNGLEEYNWDWLWGCEDSGRTYWLDQNAESYFQKSLTKKQAKHYADNLWEYEQALKEYRDEHFEEVRAGDWPNPGDEAQKECAEAMEEALGEAQKDLHRDWLYGDYRGNFEGILPQANKKYREYGIEFDYDEKNDVVNIEIDDENIQYLYEEGEIDKKTQKAVIEWVQDSINSNARWEHKKEVAEREKRAEENKKTREYQQKRAEEAREAKRAELLAL